MNRFRTAAVVAIAALLLVTPGIARADFVPGYEAAVQFSGSGAPADELRWSITVEKQDRANERIYWALGFWFEHGTDSPGYVGLQPFGNRVDGSQGQTAVFSMFGNEARLVTQNGCESGADGGQGVSCRIPYAWRVGHRYDFDVQLAGRLDLAEMWAGSVTDSATGERTEIGRWSIPASWGLMTNSPQHFTEYFDSVSSCAAQGYARVRITTPRFSFQNRLAVPQKYELNTDVKPECSGASHTKITRDGSDFVIETGL